MREQHRDAYNWKDQAFENCKKRTPDTSRIVAKSFYKELKRNGFSGNEILHISSEILALITNDLKRTKHS